ncbi:phage tail protein [Fluviispira multicolorata]|uniref:Phage tail collar domain-containing protein n=1 Tax=Fluviispira multicolorata TaxID=2654512 RepID=A0A833JB53_9BACT|nr:tail fiber protein [Fluviispira multicolorata]KAB8027425.1 hypothetical protein GCL57_14610 [Fluviispira multicolorata]
MNLKSVLFLSVFSFSSIAFAQNDNVAIELILKLEDRIQRLEQDNISRNQPLLPIGTVLAYAGENIPDGYLPCDGRELVRSQYPQLYNVIGDNHGNGNGSTTFHIPDYRGLFLRGVGANENIAPESALRLAMKPGGNVGAKVGSIQTDSERLHSHSAGELKNSASELNISGNANPIKSKISGRTNDDGGHSNWQSHIESRSLKLRGGDNFWYEKWAIFDNEVKPHSHSFTIDLPTYNLNFFQKIALPQIISGRTAEAGGKESRPKNANVNYIIKYR